MAMDLLALALLDDEDVRAMAAVWSQVGVRRFADDEERFDLWADLSGVRRHRIPQKAALLDANEICLPNGILDLQARSYLQAQILAKLPKKPAKTSGTTKTKGRANRA